jgi:phosphoribosyl 1,2-cyclic phosphate phosphodiesterase
LIVTLLGSGCSWGTPKPGCVCRSCRKALEEGAPFARKRFGLLVEGREGRLLVDAGPDLKQAMLDEGFSPRDVDAILLTHRHYDHYSGLGEFRGYKKREPTPVYATKHCLERAMHSSASYGYLCPDFLEPREIRLHEPFEAADFSVTAFELNHDLPCAGFVIEGEGKRIAVAADTRLPVKPETQEAFKNVDLLVVDAFAGTFEDVYRMAESVWGEYDGDALKDKVDMSRLAHLLFPQAKAWARELGAKQAVSVHTTHGCPPQDELEALYGDSCFQVGFDGKKIRL